MNEDQESDRLRQCLSYIRATLRNNAASTQSICETIDRAIGHEILVMTYSVGAPNSFGGGGGGVSMQSIPQDPTEPSVQDHIWRGPVHGKTGQPE